LEFDSLLSVLVSCYVSWYFCSHVRCATIYYRMVIMLGVILSTM
jgi:hypothetical protein